MSSKTGKVKWFNPNKGYGFIDQDDDEKDIFLHITALQKANISVLNEGDKISVSYTHLTLPTNREV